MLFCLNQEQDDCPGFSDDRMLVMDGFTVFRGIIDTLRHQLLTLFADMFTWRGVACINAVKTIY